MDNLLNNTPATALTIYITAGIALIWLGLIIWTYRDARTRSRDTFSHLIGAGLVLLFNLAGLIIYLLIRPKETINEAYERSIEEEALLQNIEERQTCPGCGQHTQSHWQICPHCHTQLKRPCPNCNYLLELSWDICPHCTAPQTTQDFQTRTQQGIRSTYQTTERQSDPIQFVDDSDY